MESSLSCMSLGCVANGLAQHPHHAQQITSNSTLSPWLLAQLPPLADTVVAPSAGTCDSAVCFVVLVFSGSDDDMSEDDEDEADLLPDDPYHLPINHEITLQVSTNSAVTWLSD